MICKVKRSSTFYECRQITPLFWLELAMLPENLLNPGKNISSAMQDRRALCVFLIEAGGAGVEQKK
jgi:hypothetical protein